MAWPCPCVVAAGEAAGDAVAVEHDHAGFFGILEQALGLGRPGVHGELDQFNRGLGERSHRE